MEIMHIDDESLEIAFTHQEVERFNYEQRAGQCAYLNRWGANVYPHPSMPKHYIISGHDEQEESRTIKEIDKVKNRAIYRTRGSTTITSGGYRPTIVREQWNGKAWRKKSVIWQSMSVATKFKAQDEALNSRKKYFRGWYYEIES